MRSTKTHTRSELAAAGSSTNAQDPLVWRWLTQPRPEPRRRPWLAGILVVLYLGWLAILVAFANF